MLCCVMLCCEECPAEHSSQHNITQHITLPNWYSEINVTFYSVTLARMIWLPDDGPRTETCRSFFNVLILQGVNFINFIYVQ